MHVVLRTSLARNRLRRPSFFHPEDCLRNTYETLSGTASRFSVIVDSDQLADTLRDQCHWLADDIIVSGASGNSESFQFALLHALAGDSGEPVYLVEDDYWHEAAAGELILEGLQLNPDGYVTLYDDPLYYFLSADVNPLRPSGRLSVGATRHWCETPSTTMTFAAYPWVLHRDRRVIESHLPLGGKPQDRALWAELGGRNVELIRCLPGASSHLETTAGAPFVPTPSRTDQSQLRMIDRQGSDALHGRVFVSLAVPNETAHQLVRTASAVVANYPSKASVAEMTACDALILTATEKDATDIRLRSRATNVRLVVVVGDERTARWYAGRDRRATDVNSELST
jgi:hypothetical protein